MDLEVVLHVVQCDGDGADHSPILNWRKMLLIWCYFIMLCMRLHVRHWFVRQRLHLIHVFKKNISSKTMLMITLIIIMFIIIVVTLKWFASSDRVFANAV